MLNRASSQEVNDVEPGFSWDWRVGPANRAGNFRAALLRANWTAPAGGTSKWTEVLRSHESRADRTDPALPGRGFHPGRSPCILGGRKSAASLMDANDASQTSRTQGFHRSSQTREGFD